MRTWTRLTRAARALWGSHDAPPRSRGSAPLGEVLPPFPNVRELPHWWRDRLHREVSPRVSAYWHANDRAWHVVERVPGRRAQEEGRLQLADYGRLIALEGIWPHPFKVRQAAYMADGWRLLVIVPRWELCDRDCRQARYLLTVPGTELRAAEAAVRAATHASETRQRAAIREYVDSTGGEVWHKAFRGRVMGRPLRMMTA